jgi:predicted transcriptional regulator YdeE
MPKINVSQSIIIKEKPKKIYAIISDFGQWQTWSPWLLAEPECNINTSKNGTLYHWQGEIVGEGKMRISEKSDKHDYLSAELEFIKPWKSKSMIYFHLIEKSEGTELTWTMKGGLPFFLFWMKKSMEVFIGEDYRRGLGLLKDWIETGKTNSKIDFLGIQELEAFDFIGVKRKCTTSEMGKCMEEDFTNLLTECHQKWDKLISGLPFSIYHKFDMVRDKAVYVAAVPMISVPDDLSSHMVSGKRPAMKTYSLVHLGSYRHIANGWAALIIQMRAKKFKPSKKFPPMEIYLNSPKDTDELKLKTEILFPAKFS